MLLISEYLAADLSADASADALCIINIGLLCPLSYSEEKFECLGGFLGAFRSDFICKFINMLVCL